MGVFDKYLNKKRNNGDVCRPTTENFFIGSPEAESEATITPITLDQFFEDYLDILKKVDAANVRHPASLLVRHPAQ